MKFLSYLIYGLSFFVLFTNCKEREIGANVKGPEPPAFIEFKEESLSWQSPECESDTTKCFTIKVMYPLAVNGPEKVVEIINGKIRNNLSESMDYFSDSNDPSRTMDTIAQELIQEYSATLRDVPEYTNAWSVETIGKVVYQSEQTLSIEMNNYSYLGGAHPNSYTSFLNINTDTGEEIVLAEVVSDTTSFKKIAEQFFRKNAELTETEDLSEAGYFWGKPYQLPQQFGINKEGLYLYYNAYEAAAYAFGPMDFVIPFDILGDIVDKEKL